MGDPRFGVAFFHMVSGTPSSFYLVALPSLRVTCFDFILPLENEEEDEQGFLNSLLLKP